MRMAVFCDLFPELSETFVVNEIRALRRAGHEVVVVAADRARSPHWPNDLDVPVTYVTETTPSERVLATLWLLARHPLRSLRDAAGRRHWRPAEEPRPLRGLAPTIRRLSVVRLDHLHAHFAAGAALDAVRGARLLDVTVDITAHAHDIFANPRNIAAKVREANFVTTGCEYTAGHLRSILPAEERPKVHEVVMGVDPRDFRRRSDGSRRRGHVLAVGRLVEKKGFADLVDAAALLSRSPVRARVTIVGGGPLQGDLRERIRGHGVEELVELAGPRAPLEVRDLLETATVLAMPCVVARDGDRDSMPVVVKEAMAMEVPVVVTDEVGLPELVTPECGRLVPPHDPHALADALREVLGLPEDQLKAMGRAGRARVLERANVDRETGRLVELVSRSAADRAGA